MIRSPKGMGLIPLVILIAVAGIIVTTAARSFQDTARQTQLEIDQAKAYYLAQAGVMRAVWNWYTNNTTVEIARRWDQINTTVTGNNLFKVGMTSAAADLQSNFAYYAPGITFVKNIHTQTNNTNNSVMTITIPAAAGTIPVGDMVVVCFAGDGGGSTWLPNPPQIGAVDSVGNTYTRLITQVGPGIDSNVSPKLVVWYTVLTAALANPNTITLDWTTNTGAEAVSLFHISGVDAVEAPVSASGNLPGTAINSGNLNTANANAILVGAVAVEGATTETFTPAAGWLITPPVEAGIGSGTSGMTINPAYHIVSATGAYNMSGTNSVNTDWSAGIAAFYPSARWFTSGSDRRLRQWQVYNINNGSALTLTHMKVSWTPTNGAVLNGIRLNNVSVWPGGTANSGDTVDITDTVLANNGAWQGANTYLQWNANPPDPIAVTVQFTWSGDGATTDGTSHEVVLWNGSQATGMPQARTFTINSTGQVNATLGPNNFKVLNTVKAVVSGAPGRSTPEIVDWDKGEKNIP